MSLQKVNLLVVCLLLLSCSSKIKYIYYEYNGTTITRLDEPSTTYLYYGKCTSQSDCPYIKVTYTSFDGALNGFLLFKENGYVEVINYGGGYYAPGPKKTDSLYMNSYENPVLDTVLKPFRGNYKNLIQISTPLFLEKSSNLKNNSKVKAIYTKE